MVPLSATLHAEMALDRFAFDPDSSRMKNASGTHRAMAQRAEINISIVRAGTL